jgi:hypothetical protein
MAQDVHHHPNWNALLQQQGRRSVSGHVHSHISHPGCGEQLLPVKVILVRRHRVTIWPGDHQLAGVPTPPALPERQPLRQLATPMLGQFGHQRGRQDDRAPRPGRLGRQQLKRATMPLGHCDARASGRWSSAQLDGSSQPCRQRKCCNCHATRSVPAFRSTWRHSSPSALTLPQTQPSANTQRTPLRRSLVASSTRRASARVSGSTSPAVRLGLSTSLHTSTIRLQKPSTRTGDNRSNWQSPRQGMIHAQARDQYPLTFWEAADDGLPPVGKTRVPAGVSPQGA